MRRTAILVAFALATSTAVSNSVATAPAFADGTTVLCERVYPPGGTVITNMTFLAPGPTFRYGECASITTYITLRGLGTSNFSDQPFMTTFDGSASLDVESLPANLFYGDDSLINVSLPPNITSIGIAAFYGTGMTTFTVPSGVTSLPDQVFANTAQLRSITLPSGLTSIGEDAFWRSRIESIDIPDGVTTIDTRAFNEAGALTSVDLPASLRTIGDEAFRWTALAGTLTMPSGVTDIGSEAFLDTNLRTVVLNSGVQTIGEQAFGGMFRLAGTLTIPASVTTLGDNIVDTTHGVELRELTFLGNKPDMSDDAFSALDDSSLDSPRLSFTVGTSGWGGTGTCGETVTVSGYPFTGVCIPTVTSMSPSWIPVEGGAITITGTNFMPGATVSIDGVTLSDVSRTSATTITATAPALTQGTRTLSVTNEGLRSGTTSVRYGPPPSPGSQADPSPTPSASPSVTPTPSTTRPPPSPSQSSGAGPSAAQLLAAREVRPSRVRALAQGVPPGESIVIVDGRRVRSSVTVSRQGMTVRTGPVTVGVQGRQPRGTNGEITEGTVTIPRSTTLSRTRSTSVSSIQLAGSGNAPQTPMRVFIIPQPHSGATRIRTRDLGFLMTDAEGRLGGRLSIPVRTPGSYILQINGIGSDGVLRSINVPAVVVR